MSLSCYEKMNELTVEVLPRPVSIAPHFVTWQLVDSMDGLEPTGGEVRIARGSITLFALIHGIF